MTTKNDGLLLVAMQGAEEPHEPPKNSARTWGIWGVVAITTGTPIKELGPSFLFRRTHLSHG